MPSPLHPSFSVHHLSPNSSHIFHGTSDIHHPNLPWCLSCAPCNRILNYILSIWFSYYMLSMTHSYMPNIITNNISSLVFRIYYVQGTVLSPLCELFHLVPMRWGLLLILLYELGNWGTETLSKFLKIDPSHQAYLRICWNGAAVVYLLQYKLAGCVMLGKVLNLSEPQFPHI